MRTKAEQKPIKSRQRQGKIVTGLTFVWHAAVGWALRVSSRGGRLISGTDESGIAIDTVAITLVGWHGNLERIGFFSPICRDRDIVANPGQNPLWIAAQ